MGSYIGIFPHQKISLRLHPLPILKRLLIKKGAGESVMEFAFSQKRFKNLLTQKDLFLKLLVGSFILNGIQLIDRIRVQDKVILIPPHVSQDIWVMGGVVSTSFIEEWALYLSSILLNVTPQTADFSYKAVLKYVHPESLAFLQKKLYKDLKNMKENQISTVFKAKTIEISQKEESSKAKILGTFSTFVGSKKIEEVDKTFILMFRTSSYMPQLSLLSFEEENKNEDDKTLSFEEKGTVDD